MLLTNFNKCVQKQLKNFIFKYYFFDGSIPGCGKLKWTQRKNWKITKEGKNFKGWQTVVVKRSLG